MLRFSLTRVGVLLVIAWLGAEMYFGTRAFPPEHVRDATSYLDWRPDTQVFAILDGPGGEHLMAIGPGGGVLPSGPSAYIFDRTGRLVDYSLDIGDDPDFDERWNAQSRATAAPQLPAAHLDGWLQS